MSQLQTTRREPTQKQPLGPEQSTAVVGGGMLGMFLALRLAQQGKKVTLYEAAPELGGLTAAWQLGDLTWDKFYHVILLSDFKVRNLLEELGLTEEIRWSPTKTGFFTDGRLHSMSGALEFLLFRPLNLYQKFRLGGTIFYGSKIKNWRRMESLLVEDWLRRWSGKSTFEKIWLPLLRAKLGDAYRRVSAGFIAAYIARMYQARKAGLKQDLFGYVGGGYARILQRMEEQLRKRGVTIRTGAPLKQVSVEGADQPVQLELASGETIPHSEVILTVPAPVLSRVCPQLNRDEQQRADGVEYLGVICASLLLKRKLTDFYVTNITDTSIPLTGIIEMTNVVKPEELGGRALVYLPRYLPSEDSEFNLSDAELSARFIAALRRVHPDLKDEEIERIQIARARYVMALPTLEFSQRLPPMQTSLPGVYFISSAQIVKGTLNVNETIEIAEEGLKVLAAATQPA
jgi:protoporphyrinogen oxidase